MKPYGMIDTVIDTMFKDICNNYFKIWKGVINLISEYGSTSNQIKKKIKSGGLEI